MREKKFEIERHTIELTDLEHLERLEFLNGTRVVDKPPIESELPPQLKEKFELAKKLTKKESKKDEKNQSKTTKRTAKKNNPKAISAAVESVQK